jgi:hypothetical protein
MRWRDRQDTNALVTIRITMWIDKRHLKWVMWCRLLPLRLSNAQLRGRRLLLSTSISLSTCVGLAWRLWMKEVLPFK